MRRLDIDAAEVRTLYCDRRLSCNQIAELLTDRGIRVSDEYIRGFLKSIGIEMRSKSLARLLRTGTAGLDDMRDDIRPLVKQGMSPTQIVKTLGLKCCQQSLLDRLRKWGFRTDAPAPRKPKSASEISVLASAVACARQYQHETLLTFLPENPALETEWRAVLADTRRERAAAMAII
jgi:hypothetical protein